MPPLRITLTLSILLLVGVTAATARLSQRVGGADEPRPARVSAPAPATSAADAVVFSPHHHPASVASHAHVSSGLRIAVYVPGDAATRWVPLSMSVAGLPFDRMRDCTGGGLVMHLTVNAQGQVSAARLVVSSGDSVIDGIALRLAHRWRFVVPANRPRGFSGDLPLQFASV